MIPLEKIKDMVVIVTGIVTTISLILGGILPYFTLKEKSRCNFSDV